MALLGIGVVAAGVAVVEGLSNISTGQGVAHNLNDVFKKVETVFNSGKEPDTPIDHWPKWL